MKNKIILFITVILFAFSSCSDSFLNLSDSSTLSPDNFPTTMEHMESLVTACYAQVIHINLYGALALNKGAFVSDHTVDMAWTTDEHWSKQAQNQLEPNNGNVYTLWEAYYKVVSATNTLLDCLDKFGRSDLSDAQLERLGQMQGEALFWRGWAHQQLVQYWGEGYPCNGDGEKLGIPLRLEASMTPSTLRAKRNTVNEVYNQIWEDYKAALGLLPEKWNDDNLGRPTSWTVKSYMGQLSLYRGDWASTKTILKDIIDNGPYELLAFDQYKDMFNDKQIKFNKESIMELNFIKGHTPGGYGNWAGAVSQMHSSLIAHCYRYGRDTKQGGWSNLFFHDSNIERFGSDPRLKICALEPGTEVIAEGKATTVAKYVLDVTSTTTKGWSVGKYNPVTYVPNEVSLACGINIYLMRLADVYLMYAEACLRSQDETTAKEYINKVRRRAYDKPITLPSDIDIASSGDALWNDLREERFKEFCGEGVQHWCGVCRWKTLKDELEKWYPKTLAGPTVYDDCDLYYPIPLFEMQNNPEMEQSTGY